MVYINKIYFLLYSLLPFVFKEATGHAGHKKSNPNLLLISFDGFRWDLLKKCKCKTPNFDLMIQTGTQAKWVKDAFVSKTFPNHFSIATGMYEESHGLVDNIFYDPILKEEFSFKNEAQEKESKWFDNGATPIWITNENAPPVEGVEQKRLSGSVFWPGSLAPYRKFKNKTPFRTAGDYDEKVTFKQRIDKIIDWFTDDDNPINFGALYFNEPDATEHEYGPNSPIVYKKISELDGVLGYLFDELREHEIFDNMNIIVTSDHGFAEISVKKSVFLEDYIKLKPDLYRIVGYSPILHIIPKKGHEDDVYKEFKKIPHTYTFKREEIPAKFHYSNNRRISPVLCFAELGWSLFHNKTEMKNFFGNRKVAGTHGFNNSRPEMHPFFIARGPKFHQGYQRGPIDIVDIYPLMCHVLGIDIPVNNGSFSRVQDMIHDGTMVTFITFLVILGGAACITGICFIMIVQQHRYHRYYSRRRNIQMLNDPSMTTLLSSVDDAELNDEL